MVTKKNIGLIGAGYWGLNLVRNFNKAGVLDSVSDVDIKRKKKVLEISSQLKFVSNYKNILSNKLIDAVAIATPAKTHYKLVLEALKSNKHVFVEKPLCLNISDGKKIIQLSKKMKKKVMVGHLMLYHSAYIKMKEKIEKGLIGNIRYIYSNRLALGKLRKEEDVLWSFAPHDISMINDLVKEKLINVEAYGASYLNKKVKDLTVTLLKFKKNIKAHIFVSWLHPYKDQRLVVIGDKGMIVFADVLENEKKLMFYNHDIRWDGELPIIEKAKGKKILFDYKKEPLYTECKAFLDWINLDKKPLSHVEEGIKVLKILDIAKNKLRLW